MNDLFQQEPRDGLSEDILRKVEPVLEMYREKKSFWNFYWSPMPGLALAAVSAFILVSILTSRHPASNREEELMAQDIEMIQQLELMRNMNTVEEFALLKKVGEKNKWPKNT